MEGNCSTGQSPVWAVVPMEGEGAGGGGEEEENYAQNNIASVFSVLIGSVLRKEIKAFCLPEVLAKLCIEFLMRKLRILHTIVANAHQIRK
jgi:hypothetical protein